MHIVEGYKEPFSSAARDVFGQIVVWECDINKG